MLQHPAAVRAAFDEGSATLLTALRAIGPEYWDRRGALGEWNTRELVAHTLRAYVTIEGYLDAPPNTDRVLADAAEYYAAAGDHARAAAAGLCHDTAGPLWARCTIPLSAGGACRD